MTALHLLTSLLIGVASYLILTIPSGMDDRLALAIAIFIGLAVAYGFILLGF